MRRIARLAVAAAALAVGVRTTDAQTILGFKLDLKAKPGFPTTTSLKIKSQEALSPETIDGDPATNGAVVQLIVNGGTSTSQTIVLPGGTRWKRSPRDPSVPATGWKYRDSRLLGYVSAVTTLQWAKSGSGKFKLQAAFSGKYQPLNVVVPNPGTYAGMVLAVPGGSTYCTNFGGAAGGAIVRNDPVYFRVAKPTAEGVCPSGTPVCGDGIVDAPFETCDVSNDSACPGLCGANGLACLCPFCGDAVIDPGESCDTHATLGSCTEGCSYACQCTTCGNDVVESPAEECEPNGDPFACGAGTCGGVGAPNQCQCPYCGDGVVNLAEECDGTDDAVCPGLCATDTCTCPVCGNGTVEPGEQCDVSGGPCDAGVCKDDCTCTVCGDGVTEAPEQCDGADDGACPGLCQSDCTCG
jgi:hypothetical protein